MGLLKTLQEQSRWLLKHSFDATSQCGEDGIISRALDIIPDRTRWCIEFGAWDGRKYSNTYNLITSRDYRGAFIEADPDRFRDLERIHDGNRHVLLNAFVGFSETDSLDALLQGTSVPCEIDLLSIDIDGNDYHVWEAVHSYRPKLVIIEYNPTASNSVSFVQPKNCRLNQGSSAAALVELARRKGYELIAATWLNLLFVELEYYPLFEIPDNSLDVMRDDGHCPQIFVGYDGHVFLAEEGQAGISLPWHGVKLKESEIQPIPKRLQKYPDNYTRLERWYWRFKFGFKRPKRLIRRIIGRA
jgi:hypothetical protein